MNNITISKLKQNFQDYLQSKSANINPYAVNSMWDIWANAEASFQLDLYMNLYNVEKSIYTQNLVGDQIDQKLFSLGLPERIAPTYTVVYGTIANISYPYTIVAGTVFIATNKNTYVTLYDITLNAIGDIVTVYAQTAGPLFNIEVNSVLTYNNINLTVTKCILGSNSESDQNAINRILLNQRSPSAGARESDYYNYCLEANAQVTDVIIVPNWFKINSVGILGVVPLVGNTITDYQLDLGLLSGDYQMYSREASTGILTQITNYIDSVRLIGANPDVVPNKTFLITNYTINIQVALDTGYNLNSIINVNTTDINNNIITANYTITQLIQKEVRRIICNQPYGATKISNTNWIIPLDNIYTGLNNQLSTDAGAIAKILKYIAITGNDIPVPNNSVSNTYISQTYDINYNKINVSLKQ